MCSYGNDTEIKNGIKQALRNCSEGLYALNADFYFLAITVIHGFDG